AIPQATVGTAAPTTNIRTETNAAWVTCARTTASSLEMAAAISATQARNPITLRAIRAVINRCPIVDTPYRAAPALPDSALHIRSPSSAQAGRVSWRSRDLITRQVFITGQRSCALQQICPAMSALGQADMASRLGSVGFTPESGH